MVKKNKKKSSNSDSDEDDTFYFRYASASSSAPSTQTQNPTNKPSSRGGGSGTLAPSKSTLYVSNIDYSLTNSDLHTLFSTFGKIARVTVLKNRETRVSRGVAFIQYVSRKDALNASQHMTGKILNGRTLTVSIAADNGRAPEFIRKRVYKDKSRCYECGAEGHLSYECPKNQLGPRERPVPKKGRRDGLDGGDFGDGGGDVGDAFEEDNWASVVDNGADERLLKGSDGDFEEKNNKMKKGKASYFSDESGDEED